MKKIILIIFLFFIACSNNNVIINNIEYEKNNVVFKQLTSDDNDVAVFGVLSDIHGNVEKVKYFLEIFRNNGVEYLILPGDIGEQEEQIYEVLRVASELSVPVFIIPGNHESKDDYYNSIKKINKDNIIDCSKFRFFDGDDADLAFVPGYFIQSMTIENGFIFNESDVDIIRTLIINNTILVAHSPPKFTTKNAIDVIYDGKNVGSNELTSLIKENNISFGIFGHIHEAGAKAIDLQEQKIKENSWSSQLFLNPSSVIPWTLLNGTNHQGSAAIFWVNNSRAKYKIIT